MAELVGLPNTTGNREAVFFRSAAEAVKAMRQSGCAATAAADNGCLNVWIDDDDQYQCEAQRFMETLDSQVFSTFKDVAAWVKKWLPKIQR